MKVNDVQTQGSVLKLELLFTNGVHYLPLPF